MTPAQIAAGLSEAQKDIILSVDPHDVTRDQYQPFYRCSLGMFEIAPGWGRMELSPIGLAVREILENEDDR